MEQIRQLLSQLSLHLELNIAMCDMIEKMEKRLDKIEPRFDALSSQLSQFGYHLADQRFQARQEAKKGGK